jgi:hypothetical protein
MVHLVGHWTTRAGAPVVTEVSQQLDASPPVRRLAFATQELTGWDSRLLTFLRQVMEASAQRQLVVEQQGLPEGVRRLLALAAAVPEREGARRGPARLSWLARLGTEVVLVALWRILSANEKELVMRPARFTAAAGRQDYEATVLAMGRTLEALSQDMAAALLTIVQPAPRSEQGAPESPPAVARNRPLQGQWSRKANGSSR